MLSRIGIAFALVFALAACGGRGDISIQRGAEGGLNITVSASEADVNAVVSDALARQANPLLRNPQVDLQAGQIVVNGEHDRRDGQGAVSGSLTITATVVNNRLQMQVTAADIEGIALTDERIADLNARLSEALNRLAERQRENVRVTAVTITANALEITINAQRG